MLSLSMERLNGFLADFSSIGNRWTGSKGEAEARNYVAEKFRAQGLAATMQEFDYVNYKPTKSSVSITLPLKEEIACNPLEYTANAAVEGEALYVGDGSERSFMVLEKSGVGFRGKIAIARTPFPFLISSTCEKYGVSGLIVITDPPLGLIRWLTAILYPRNPRVKPPFTDHMTTFPGATINIASADLLWSLLSQGRVTVKLEHRAEYTKQKTANVVGVVQGTDLKEKVVVIGAHLDSQFAGPCVCDNAGGIAALLELSRIFAFSKPKRTIVFAAFTGEEIGLWGSTEYVRAHEDNLRRNCVAMLNLDDFGSTFKPENALWATDDILDFVRQRIEAVGGKVDSTFDLFKLKGGDYAPFIDIGIQATFIWGMPPNPYYHTERDIIDYMDMKKFMKIVEVHERLLYDLANLPELPFQK